MVTASLDTLASNTHVIAIDSAGGAILHCTGEKVVGIGELHPAVELALVRVHQVSVLGHPFDVGGQVSDVVLESIEGLALLLSEVCSPLRALGSAAGLVPHSVPSAVEASSPGCRPVTLPH